MDCQIVYDENADLISALMMPSSSGGVVRDTTPKVPSDEASNGDFLLKLEGSVYNMSLNGALVDERCLGDIKVKMLMKGDKMVITL